MKHLYSVRTLDEVFCVKSIAYTEKNYPSCYNSHTDQKVSHTCSQMILHVPNTFKIEICGIALYLHACMSTIRILWQFQDEDN